MHSFFHSFFPKNGFWDSSHRPFRYFIYLATHITLFPAAAQKYCNLTTYTIKKLKCTRMTNIFWMRIYIRDLQQTSDLFVLFCLACFTYLQWPFKVKSFLTVHAVHDNSGPIYHWQEGPWWSGDVKNYLKQSM